MKTHLEQVREVWGDVETYVRKVWGREATYDIVGKSVLIHLDKPDAKTRRARNIQVAERDLELKVADCPLCRDMAEQGGDEVYDDTPRSPVPALASDADYEGAILAQKEIL